MNNCIRVFDVSPAQAKTLTRVVLVEVREGELVTHEPPCITYLPTLLTNDQKFSGNFEISSFNVELDSDRQSLKQLAESFVDYILTSTILASYSTGFDLDETFPFTGISYRLTTDLPPKEVSEIFKNNLRNYPQLKPFLTKLNVVSRTVASYDVECSISFTPIERYSRLDFALDAFASIAELDSYFD